jgi:hypothetical protein
VTLHIHQRVSDYFTWKRAFDELVTSPVASDVNAYRVWQGRNDPAHVIVEFLFDSQTEAEAFAFNPVLTRELQHAGVDEASLRFEFLDQVAFWADPSDGEIG